MRLLEVNELRNTLATLMEVATEDQALTGAVMHAFMPWEVLFTLSDLEFPLSQKRWRSC